MNGFAELLAHQRVTARELGVARERLLDALGVAAAQRAGGVPRQELFDVLALGASCFIAFMANLDRFLAP